jgi:hypothetical protein
MQEEMFRAFVPIDIIEKADEKKDKDGLPEKLVIAGVASTPKFGKDKDGHRLNVSGFDYKPLLEKGFLNLEHAYEKTKDASMIVGIPTNAYVINDEFHIEGELFRDNPKAVAIYKLGQTLKKAGSKRRIGYSIEGSIVEKNPKDPGDIRKSLIKHVALTISPKCDGTEMLVKGGDDVFEYENQNDSEFLVDIVDEGVRYVVDKNLNILKSEGGSNLIAEQNAETAEEKQRVTALESLDKVKKKKKKEGYLTKAEVLYKLISEHKMDSESCKRFYALCEEIEKISSK